MIKNMITKKVIASVMAVVVGLSVAGTSMVAEACPPPPPSYHHHRHCPPPPPPVHHHHHDSGYDGGDVAAAAIVGLVLGAVIANS